LGAPSTDLAFLVDKLAFYLVCPRKWGVLVDGMAKNAIFVFKFLSIMTLIIVIAVIALLVVWIVSIQNTLVKSDEVCNNALKQINVQQISRFDALQALVKLTREYSSYEADTLQKIVDARKQSTNPTVADINANEQLLSQIGSKLIAVAEAYPDLKASTNYQETMKSLKEYEENVRLSRMTFNDTVTRYNQQVRVFPASLVAGLLGFAKRDYLEEDKSKKDYPVI
jgi:LemA protein